VNRRQRGRRRAEIVEDGQPRLGRDRPELIRHLAQGGIFASCLGEEIEPPDYPGKLLERHVFEVAGEAALLGLRGLQAQPIAQVGHEQPLRVG
jgi:hypothetical protein